MRRQRLFFEIATPAIALAALLALVFWFLARRPAASQPDGVAVTEIGPGSEAEKAGLAIGDVVLSWSRAGSGGPLRSPYDLAEVETEQGARGPVELAGYRRGTAMTWKLGRPGWGLTCRPAMPAAAMQQYQEARDLIRSNRAADAATRLESAAQILRSSRPAAAAWLLDQAARALTRARSWQESERLYRQASALLTPLSASAAAQVLMAAGEAAYGREDLAGAEAFFREALTLRQKYAPKGLGTAHTLTRLGKLERRRGNMDIAQKYLTASIALLQSSGPDGLEMASALTGLGTIEVDLSRYDEARKHYQRALEIQRRLAPGSAAMAGTLNDFGLLEQAAGDVASAQEDFTGAARINEKLAPNGLELARNLNNLGLVATDRGDLARAEQYFLRALDIQNSVVPDSVSVGISLANLGAIARDRWDLDRAEDLYRRALAIYQRQAAESPVARGLKMNLGDVALERGDTGLAERRFREVLAEQKKAAPGSTDVVAALHALGVALKRKGDLAEAGRIYRQAIALQEKLSPGSLDLASILHDFGELQESAGDFAHAGENFRRAWAIRHRLSPGSAAEADSLYALARMATRKRDLAGAAQSFEASISALETQSRHLGGQEELQAGFVARNAAVYRAYMDLLLASKRAKTAFHVLERSRAQSLLRMLAERDLEFSAEISPALQKARGKIDTEYDRTQEEISELNPRKEAGEIDTRLARLRELAAERARVDEQIKQASPRLAALRYPKPLGVDEARAALDPGTVVLSYAVGPEHTVLFVLRADGPGPGLQTFTLPLAESSLRARVTRFYTRLRVPAGQPANLRSDAQELYGDLVAPAEPVIEHAARILVIPDGPLHLLPFDALMRGDRYLVEWKPVHTAVSLTVYAQLRAPRRTRHRSDPELVAFGDPRYASGNAGQLRESGDAELRSAVARGIALEPLPFSRVEVEAIARLFEGHSRTYLGENATEKQAKSIGRDVRYLHFATHSLLDERFPLNSSLVLTIPERPRNGEDNGLLQAWEIIEGVRWNADLVVLSACRTGLGRQLAGEGFVGLTRAIQFAGARAVLASLWSVDDRRTSTLMQHFYSELKTGRSKDEALRAAQVEMLRSPASARPFYWAAFVLNGDRR